MKHLFAAALATVVLYSCAATNQKQIDTNLTTIDAATILEASPLQGDIAIGDLSRIDLLATSPEMIAFIDTHVDRDGSQNEKLSQLVDAVIGDDRFQLAYDDSTRTAASTFSDRRGNCISFTTLFVAMARNVGLNASYQEVTIPPDWTMTGQSLIVSKHVNVLVEMRNALARVVDFNSFTSNIPNESQVISDQRARAHYFNNIGVERMFEDETSLAYANFRESLLNDKEFSSSWVNIGILHRREGYPAFAETAYKEALKYDSSSLVAMSNLANLYAEQGKTELSEKYLERVHRHRMTNPYYRYQAASTAFSDGDYETAIQNLKYAIRKRKDEDRFYFLLSLSYLMSGEKQLAQNWMKKAEEVAAESASRQKYHHKLDLLMGINGDS